MKDVFLVTGVLAAVTFGGLLLAQTLPTPTAGGPGAVVVEQPAGPQNPYLDRLQADGQFTGVPDTTLLTIGHSLCRALTHTAGPDVHPVPLRGISAADTREVADAATAHLCPAQRPKLAVYLRGTR